jgi:Mg2+/Co2+ transporter CorB
LSGLLISILVCVMILLVLLSSFFSAAETSMMAINRYRLKHLARHGHRSAKRTQNLLEHTDKLLSTILIGNTCTNIIASSLATMLAVRFYGEIGVAVTTAILTFVVLIFGEILPKTVAALNPERIAFATSLPLKFMLKLLSPISWGANLLSRSFLTLFGVSLKSSSEALQLSAEELRTVVTETGSRLSKRNKNMLLRILDLKQITVNDIMIPSNEVIGVDLTDPWDAIVNQLYNNQHTRLPLYENNLNNVKGIVHLRNILCLRAGEVLTKEMLISLAQTPYFVPEGTPLTTQLLKFQNNKKRIALVVDEYGNIQGLITLDDILEEIVGEFTTDLAESNKEIVLQADDSYLVDGSIGLRKLNRTMGWKFRTDGPKTLSGLIIEHLEAIPEPGIAMRISGYPVEIIEVKDNTVKVAKIFPHLRKIEKRRE